MSFDFVSDVEPYDIFDHQLPNYGVLFSRIDKSTLDTIREKVLLVRKQDKKELSYTGQLAGHLKKEYDIADLKDLVYPFLKPMVETYTSKYHILRATNTMENGATGLSFGSIWVNFMSKTEFNPLHKHDGVLSFVLWVKIPYDLNEEMKMYPDVNNQQTSCFCFGYSDVVTGNCISVVPVDKSYEGVICMFPSLLSHYVNPFYTSDEERISISGNFYAVL